MSKVYVDDLLEDFMLWFVANYEVEDMRVYELDYGEEWKRKDVVNEYLGCMKNRVCKVDLCKGD